VATTRSKKTRWTNCNVLQWGEAYRHIWSFNAAKNGFSLDKDQTFGVLQALPPKLVAKDWKTLFLPRLNIAWLPIEKVFLRVVQLPGGDFNETLSMVELQLEKISPLPVTQIAWTIQLQPHHADNLQTVVVVIVSRDIVEEFLGQLEGQGYLADRLELPMLDQLGATPITEDGAWLYPSGGTDKLSAVVAWWYGGVLQNLGLVHVPATENNAALLKEQLSQMAWAGELDGWLTGQPRWHLVADEATANAWQPLFRTWLGRSADVTAPLSPPELAALTANRAARALPGVGLLPAEYGSKYRDQFVDRLLMRGLAALFAIYMMGIMIYFVALQFKNGSADNKATDAAGLATSYTNTLQLKAQLKILQDRDALKNAALDCWKITAELLPESLTVLTMEFRNGDFHLAGNTTVDQQTIVTQFGSTLRKSTMEGRQVFSQMATPQIHVQNGNATWTIGGVLARSEEDKP
jgi:hypothetical protein